MTKTINDGHDDDNDDVAFDAPPTTANEQGDGGMDVDVVSEGINKTVRILNPQETASCGCGASVNF